MKTATLTRVFLVTMVLALALMFGVLGQVFAEPSAATDTLNLKINDVNRVAGVLPATNFQPGQTLGPETIVLKNDSNMDGSSLDIYVSYMESDNETFDSDTNFEFAAVNNPAYEKTADEFADELQVDILTYGEVDLTSSIADADGDGIDMKEVATADLTGLPGIPASTTRDFVIQVTVKTSMGNAFQADGIDVTITFTLNQ